MLSRTRILPGAFLVSLLLAALPFTFSSAVQASDEEFLGEEMFVSVLNNLVENYSLPDGDWTHSEMRDIIGFAPRMMFSLYEETGRQSYRDKGTATVDFEMAMLQAAWEDPEYFKEAAAGALALVDGYRYLKDPAYRQAIGPLTAILNAAIIFAPEVLENPDLSFYDPMYMGGAVVGVSYELFDAVRVVRGWPDFGARHHLQQGRRILRVVGREYWDEDKGCYRSDPDDPVLYFGEQPNMLMAYALEYNLTGRWLARMHCDVQLESMNTLWADSWGGGYLFNTDPQSELYFYKGLAEHMVVLMSLVLLYERSGDNAYRETAEGLVEFLEDSLYGNDEAGNPVILHDTQNPVYWCSGCNMFTLYAIYRLNRALGNPLPAALF